MIVAHIEVAERKQYLEHRIKYRGDVIVGEIDCVQLVQFRERVLANVCYFVVRNVEDF